MGYDIGDTGIDGIFGHYTEHGIRQFQKKEELTIDGIVDKKTHLKFEECIKKLQTNLYRNGYYIGDAGVDGDFGYYTQAAVKRYQKDHQLVIDGVAGIVTRNCIIDNNKQLQLTLNTLGYEFIEVDGNLNEKTINSILIFQKDHQLKEDGIAGPITRGVLKESTREIQRQLIGMGYDIGNSGIDGILGNFTIHGIRQFQKENNLTVNGIYNQNTRSKMIELVKSIQKALKKKKIKKKYYIGENIDGHFGHYTENGIKKFQKDNQLIINSICGPITKAKLLNNWIN